MDAYELATGYGERFTRIALFEPFQDLKRKTMRDEKDKKIDVAGMGLLCLLYFFEQKLIRNTKAGVREFASFLEMKTGGVYVLSPSKWESLSRDILQVFRPSTGRRYSVTYMDWESGQEEIVSFSFFKANTFDVKTNTQYYTLDDDGLELVFATKEFYSEFQLSINQLLLRKQLEKGEFKGALRQINEMRIDVESLEERILHLTHELKRNITSEETFQRYSRLIEDILLRLSMEHEEFEALQGFVNETKKRLYYKDHTKKEKEAYALILQISTHLEEVHHQHTDLLHACTEMKTRALQAAQEALYFVGIDSFNFDQDITSRIISTPLALESMKGLVSPFLSLEQAELWSPLTLFANQQVRDIREEAKGTDFLEVESKEEQEYVMFIRNRYTELFSFLLEYMEEENSITLDEFISYIQHSPYIEMLDSRIFYDFFLLLHHRSPLLPNEEEQSEETHVLDGVRKLLEGRKLEVFERNNLLTSHERYLIQNMEIQVKEIDDDVI
ncbi:replicative DNA helicase [Sporosarcina sp. GW1-11]|uniref:replicative DNA helicase n=1 Tax=Sporosarcina sp. GW1-11 TaxID=2899126 RepID=UPI00294D9A58|nr:replicative DNA helicase [Sporosarcina sp. GW1-11]MDV6378729.1 replicative DNA helicase [Sporosarcina sp. GW1-11]